MRDEDLRADHGEHTQIDLEMSFVTEADIAAVVEGLMKEVFRYTGDDIKTPFLELEYEDVMKRYGTDKPDLRYAFEVTDVSGIFRDSGFKVFSGALAGGGSIASLTVDGAGIPRSAIDRLEENLKKQGAKGLPWIRWTDPRKPESGIVKFLKPEELSRPSGTNSP